MSLDIAETHQKIVGIYENARDRALMKGDMNTAFRAAEMLGFMEDLRIKYPVATKYAFPHCCECSLRAQCYIDNHPRFIEPSCMEGPE